MKKYEKQKEENEKELKELADIEQKDKLDKFLKAEGKLVTSSLKKATINHQLRQDLKNLQMIINRLVVT